ncbi:MAG: hypothetical protein DAHOPDDO_00068 [Ignavibacteriaceae bacterium]|nr:hypothetical protein [Ignavibacteriaceae bacterium]
MSNKIGEINLNQNIDFQAYEDVKVSWAKDVFETEFQITNLGQILQTIRDNEGMKNRIETVQTIKNKEKRQMKKSQLLPYFVIGQFIDNKRKNVNLISTQHFIFDYDGIGNKLKSSKEKLREDNSVNFFFTSPSGNGLKVGYKLDKPITAYETFSAIYKYYAKKLGIELGEKADKTSAASNPCYFSYDSVLYTNSESISLSTDIPEEDLEEFRTYSKVNWEEVKVGLNGLSSPGRTQLASEIIGVMIGRNVPREITMGLLQGWNTLNKPPLPDKKIIYQVNDMYDRYEKQIDTVPIKFIDKGNAYFKRVYWNKEWLEIPVTSFRIIPSELLVLEDSDCLVCDLVTNAGYHYKDIKIENTDWHTKQKFLKAVAHQDCGFHGTEQELQALCQFIQLSIPVRKEATKVIGLYKNEIWVTENYNITKETISKDQLIVPYDKGKDAFYHGIDYKDLTDDEYRDMITVFYKNVLQLNESDKIASYLGWLFATPIKPHLIEIADGFPLLFNHGSQGAGKTSLAQLFMRLVGYKNSDPKSCTMKLFPMLKMLSSTNAIPQWYDEFKKADMKETDVDNLLRYMRRAYKGEVEDKGRADQTVETYNITAPMAVMGEWNINQPAIMERVILIRFNDYVKKKQESQDAFRALKQIDLEAFMPRYIKYCLDQNVNELYDNAREIVINEFENISVALRIVTNLSILIVGLELFKGFAEVNQIEVPELDYKQILNYQLKEITGSNNGSVRSAVDQLIEELAIMAEKEEIKSPDDYKKVNTNNSVNALAIRFNKIFPDFVVYAKKTSYEGDLLDKSSYIKLFDDCDYVIQKNMTVKMGDKAQRCLVLDIDKIKTKGLSIDGLLEAEERQATIEGNTLTIK